MRGNPNKELMQDPREDKNGDTRRSRTPAPSDQWREHMPLHELIYGLVPRPPIHAHAWTVPPIRVELPVSESRHFGQGVEKGLEESEKAGKPNHERNCRKLHEALKDGDEVQVGDFFE